MDVIRLAARRSAASGLAAAALLIVATSCGGGGSPPSPDADPPPADVGVETSMDADTDETQTDDSSVIAARDSDSSRPPPTADTGIWDLGGSDDAEAPDLALSSIVPNRGSTGGGTKFVLEGQGFTDDTTVYFAGRKADVRFVGDDLVGQTPRIDSPGAVPVKATDPAAGSDSLADAFQYVEPLSLDSANPSSIPVRGGFQVTLQGAGFTRETRVSFSGRNALHHEFVGPETLRVIAPAHPAGTVDLRLTNRDETTVAPEAVTYVQPVEIEEIRPASGPTGGGIRATLRGRGFRPGMMVSFGGLRATLRSVDANGTRATVEVPSHSAGRVDVSVTSATGGGATARDAFYYRSAADEFRLASLDPDRGRAGGGDRVRLVGAGLDRNGLDVRFGGTRAAILSRGTGWAIVESPPHSKGTVDVTIRDGAGARSTLQGAFTYLADLSVDDVRPQKGPAAGGTTVTLDGTGFQGVSDVRFGGVVASYSVIDNSTIEVTTPSHAPGTFDVTVERGALEATDENAFTFEQSLEVYGVSPARGSIAGHTYVLVRGEGFTGSNLSVTFDGTDAKSVQQLDAQTIAVRTPPHPAGDAPVRIRRGSDTSNAPQPFRYFNPTSRDGGPWGGSIDGSVNIAVFSESQRPIPGAFAMLSTNSKSRQTAWTDQDGLATLSGPNVYGPQTITVTARGYSSATFQRIDASNLTVFLNRVPIRSTPGDTGVSDTRTGPSDTALDVPTIDTSENDVSADVPNFDAGSTPSPPIDASYDSVSGPSDPPPPDKGPPMFTGRLTGLEKIASLGPNERKVATVYTTKTSIRARNPPPGAGNRLFGNGTYRIETRTGDLALVAVGGVLNTSTGAFEPLRLGVNRYQNAVRGKTYQRDIDLDIRLDRDVTFKIAESPLESGGPNIHFIRPFLDFGFEGVFGRLKAARGTGRLVVAEHYPELVGPLSDVTISTIGGSYTEQTRGNGLSAPQSITLDDGIPKTGAVVQYPELLGVPKITDPPSGRRPTNGSISFRLTSRIEPEFFWVRVIGRRSVVWDMFVPGSARSVQLPDFPSFDSQPKRRRPQPYSSSRLSVRITAIRSTDATYDDFGYSDLSLFEWSAYGLSFHRIRF